MRFFSLELCLFAFFNPLPVKYYGQNKDKTGFEFLKLHSSIRPRFRSSKRFYNDLIIIGIMKPPGCLLH
jgi:hypothetical protein